MSLSLSLSLSVFHEHIMTVESDKFLLLKVFDIRSSGSHMKTDSEVLYFSTPRCLFLTFRANQFVTGRDEGENKEDVKTSVTDNKCMSGL